MLHTETYSNHRGPCIAAVDFGLELRVSRLKLWALREAGWCDEACLRKLVVFNHAIEFFGCSSTTPQ